MSKLNNKQLEAVVSENRYVLVLAGAGSGKTSTLLHKINYLIEEKQVSPASILAITFARNTAEEMKERLITDLENRSRRKNYSSKPTNANTSTESRKAYKWIENLTIKTFHGFCYAVMTQYGDKAHDNIFKIISSKKSGGDEFSKNAAPETAFEIVKKLLVQLSSEDQFLLLLKHYVLDYLVDNIDLQVGKQITKDGKYFRSLDGTEVRSKSEQSICDWLYRHGIQYEYEPFLHVTEDFGFHPDFYIPDACLYLEHVSDLSYPMKGKEKQFRKGKLLYVKTCDSMTKDSVVLNATLDKLIKNRLPSDRQPKYSLNFNEEFDSYHDKIKEFINCIIHVNDMITVDNLDLQSVLHDAEGDQHERIRLFYKLAGQIIISYREYCTDKSYLDFNGLISQTVSSFEYADILNIYKNRYEYILVDEFQDVNSSQVELLQRLLTDETQLFCVADDWQSIYCFRGANVKYTVNFEEYFPGAEVVKLNLNYRSTQNIIQAADDVIKHNKFKVEKEVQGIRRSGDRIVVYAGNNEEENVQFCADKVRELLSDGIAGEEILFLYRIKKVGIPYIDYFENEGLDVQFQTIHGAKGMEAKIVFILGLTAGDKGFPYIRATDRIYDVVRKSDYDLLLEEERRLFYVSISRAKDKLFLITEKGMESKFIKEISAGVLDRISLHNESLIEHLRICEHCSRQLDADWMLCPWCEPSAHS